MNGQMYIASTFAQAVATAKPEWRREAGPYASEDSARGAAALMATRYAPYEQIRVAETDLGFYVERFTRPNTILVPVTVGKAKTVHVAPAHLIDVGGGVQQYVQWGGAICGARRFADSTGPERIAQDVIHFASSAPFCARCQSTLDRGPR